MNILIINGSPKGKKSVTYQTSRYLEKLYSNQNFNTIHVSQKIKSIERNFDEIEQAIQKAQLIIFSYPVYTFLAPYQLHRFIELMHDKNISLKGKFATQITTSKRFFDITAHKYIEQNLNDFGAHIIEGMSCDMEDLLSEKGQHEAVQFFEKVMFDVENGIHKTHQLPMRKSKKAGYVPSIENVEKTGEKDVVIITNASESDENLKNMILDFQNACNHKTRVINIRDFNFSGGCIGCMSCSVTGNCIYKDGFEDFLRGEIQNADSIIYAYTIENHYTHSSFKCYDDRQFCNGHRAVTHGMPVGYIISGPYHKESNIQVLVEGRSQVGGVYLCHVVTDETNPKAEILCLAKTLDYALTHKLERPKNFYAVGGNKIFRDLVYLMQGMMKADHKFYKKTKMYDFPHNNPIKLLQMKLIGSIINFKPLQKQMKSKMSQFIIMPYDKLIEKTLPKQ